MNAALVNLAIQEAPAAIELLRAAFHKEKPGADTPSDAQIFFAYRQAFESSLAKDAAWLAQHPEDAP